MYNNTDNTLLLILFQYKQIMESEIVNCVLVFGQSKCHPQKDILNLHVHIFCGKMFCFNCCEICLTV